MTRVFLVGERWMLAGETSLDVTASMSHVGVPWKRTDVEYDLALFRIETMCSNNERVIVIETSDNPSILPDWQPAT